MTWGIATIAVVLAIIFIFGVRAAGTRTGLPPSAVLSETGQAAVVVVGWLGGFAIAAASGALASKSLRPPPLVLVAAFSLGGAVLLGASKSGKLLAEGLPLAALVGFQAFRLPLELVMHKAAEAGVMPSQMTWTGWNFDIVTGTTALVLAPWVASGRAPRWLVLAWNAMGSVLVAVAMGLGIAATPVFHAFGDRDLNTWIAYFPFVWLPSVMVAAAIAGHILVFRKLTGRDGRTGL